MTAALRVYRRLARGASATTATLASPLLRLALRRTDVRTVLRRSDVFGGRRLGSTGRGGLIMWRPLRKTPQIVRPAMWPIRKDFSFCGFQLFGQMPDRGEPDQTSSANFQIWERARLDQPINAATADAKLSCSVPLRNTFYRRFYQRWSFNGRQRSTSLMHGACPLVPS
jgi:hypothetical protein